jgi:hypothetical protein
VYSTLKYSSSDYIACFLLCAAEPSAKKAKVAKVEVEEEDDDDDEDEDDEDGGYLRKYLYFV